MLQSLCHRSRSAFAAHLTLNIERSTKSKFPWSNVLVLLVVFVLAIVVFFEYRECSAVNEVIKGACDQLSWREQLEGCRRIQDINLLHEEAYNSSISVVQVAFNYIQVYRDRETIVDWLEANLATPGGVVIPLEKVLLVRVGNRCSFKNSFGRDVGKFEVTVKIDGASCWWTGPGASESLRQDTVTSILYDNGAISVLSVWQNGTFRTADADRVLREEGVNATSFNSTYVVGEEWQQLKANLDAFTDHEMNEALFSDTRTQCTTDQKALNNAVTFINAALVFIYFLLSLCFGSRFTVQDTSVFESRRRKQDSSDADATVLERV